MTRWLVLMLMVGCLPPGYASVERPAAKTAEPTVAVEAKKAPATVHVAIFDPSGGGNWGSTLTLSPAPASVVAPCLEPGATGWIGVAVETHTSEASTTSLVEAAPLSDRTRTCIVNALASVHLPPELSPMRLLLYVTFSPE